MKTRILLTVTFALVALLLGRAAPASAAGYEIHFVGYCDGLHLEVPSLGLGGYTVDGHLTGCNGGRVLGIAKPNLAGQYGPDKGKEYVTVPSYNFLFVVNKNKTWASYYVEENRMKRYRAGTWGWGLPAAGPGMPSSMYKPDAAARSAVQEQDVSIQSAKDITFNGFCDGMHLVSPSKGLGKRNTVDGYRTGCMSDGLMGFKDKINGQRGTYVVMFHATEAAAWLQAVIFPDKTWRVFGANVNNQIYQVNAGTWRAGTPGLPLAAPSTRK